MKKSRSQAATRFHGRPLRMNDTDPSDAEGAECRPTGGHTCAEVPVGAMGLHPK
jgi:hypothetical protein